MKLDLSQHFYNEHDMPFVDESKQPIKAKALISKALAYSEDDSKDFIKKAEAYELYKKVKDSDEATDFSLSELNAITNAVGKVFGVLICGQLQDLIHGSKKA